MTSESSHRWRALHMTLGLSGTKLAAVAHGGVVHRGDGGRVDGRLELYVSVADDGGWREQGFTTAATAATAAVTTAVVVGGHSSMAWRMAMVASLYP